MTDSGWMRAMRKLMLVLAAGASLAGCAGGDDGDGGDTAAIPTAPGATVTQASPTPAADEPQPLPEAGETLVEFVRAADKMQVTRMWGLLSEKSRVSLGPTLGDFESGTAEQFKEGVGSLIRGKGFKVILSQKITDRWAVAAVAAERAAGGKRQYYAYGVALTPQQGRWKIELGEVLIHGLKPTPLANTKPKPAIGISVQALLPLTQAGIWLDGKPLKESGTVTPQGVTLTATPTKPLAPGRHTVVAFSSTEEAASGTAWTFTVG